jgi:hypothetical protein
LLKPDLASGQIIARRVAKAFSFLASQQKGKNTSSLRPLRLCGETSISKS